jgi:hypothetical protein
LGVGELPASRREAGGLKRLTAGCGRIARRRRRHGPAAAQTGIVNRHFG